MEKLLKEMHDYALENDVPIIEKDGLRVLKDIIIKNDVKSILEIGTAIGYSALNFHTYNDCNVITIERDCEMHTLAKEYVSRAKKEDMVKLIYADALIFDEELPIVDMIYIDAAKAQYRKFFEKYEVYLKEGGVIVFDNLDFHGWTSVPQEEIKSRNLRQLVRKINAFKEFIENNKQYDYQYIEDGDGIGVVKRKKENIWNK